MWNGKPSHVSMQASLTPVLGHIKCTGHPTCDKNYGSQNVTAV